MILLTPYPLKGGAECYPAMATLISRKIFSSPFQGVGGQRGQPGI